MQLERLEGLRPDGLVAAVGRGRRTTRGQSRSAEKASGRGRVGVVDMHYACEYAVSMSKMIQLRNVPDVLHRKLKARAALEGMSLSEYLISEVRRAAERPSISELRERLAQRSPIKPDVSPARAVRREREAR